MPLLDYAGQNIRDGYVAQVQPTIEGLKITNPEWLMLQQAFRTEPATGKQCEVRQWKVATETAEIIKDPRGDWPIGGEDIFTRYAKPTEIGMGLMVDEETARRLGGGIDVAQHTEALFRACIMKEHELIMEALEADVPGVAGKSWSWRSNAELLTIPIESKIYAGQGNYEPPVFLEGEAWALGLTGGKITLATETAIENKAFGPYIVVAGQAALNQLYVDPAYANADLSLARSMQIQQPMQWGRVPTFRTMAKVPKRVAIHAGAGGIPANQPVQVAYLISIPEFVRYQFRPMTATLREDPYNPTVYRTFVGSEVGFMRKNEGAVVAIEYYPASTSPVPVTPSRGR
jgi:hypothetical protein